MFNCDDDFESGSSYLKADYRLECDGSEYDGYLGYTIFMMFVYPIGIPLFFLIISATTIGRSWDKSDDNQISRKCETDCSSDLANMQSISFTNVYNRSLSSSFVRDLENRLKIERARRSDSLKPYAPLFEAYKPEFWYWECVECLRRFSLTGLLVFMYPGSDKQILLAMMICMFWIMVYSHIQPYLYHAHNKILIAAQWGILLQLFLIYLIVGKILDADSAALGGLAVFVGVAIPFLYVAGNFNIKSRSKSVSLSWMEKMRMVVEEEKGESGSSKEVEMGRN